MIRDCPAYVIARPERAEAAVDRLRASGWRGALHVSPAQWRETHEKSCCAAHRAAVEAGMAAGTYPFFVIEDDAHPTRWQRDLPLPRKGTADCLRLDLSVCSWNAAASTWETSPEWEAVDTDWVRLVNMLGAAAVGLCSRAMARAYLESAIRGEAQGIPIDVLTNESGRKYRILALRRPLFYQGPQTNHNAAGTNVVL
jgi:hypothetical protein